ECQRLSRAIIVASDVSPAAPADELEYTASSSSVSFVLSPDGECPFRLSQAVSYVTDTSDFYRRDGVEFPTHTYRFTGEPAYHRHVKLAAAEFFRRNGVHPHEFRFAVFHQPSQKFP